MECTRWEAAIAGLEKRRCDDAEKISRSSEETSTLKLQFAVVGVDE